MPVLRVVSLARPLNPSTRASSGEAAPPRSAPRRLPWGEGPGTGRRSFPCPSEPAPSTSSSALAATAHPMLTALEMAELFARAGAGRAPSTPDDGPPPGRALLQQAREGPSTGRRVRPPVAAGPPGKGGPRVPSRPCDDAEEALQRELRGRRGC